MRFVYNLKLVNEPSYFDILWVRGYKMKLKWSNGLVNVTKTTYLNTNLGTVEYPTSTIINTLKKYL